MSFISFAQNLEDVMLYRALKHVEKGFYIDVGAQHPIYDSITKAFYDRGWHGINIEPSQRYFKILEQERTRDININKAIMDHEGLISFYEVPNTGMSTIKKDYAEQSIKKGYEIEEQSVACTTLDAVCTQYKVNTVHFLIIDVEGAEKAVLQGCSFSDIRPWIVIIEANKPNSTEDSSHEWEDIILRKNYQFIYYDGLNKFYIAQEKSELKTSFQVPPNFFDDFINYHYWFTQQDLEKERTQFSELQNSLSNMLPQLASFQSQLQSTQQELLDAKTQQNLLVEQLQRVYSSYSWRITAPFRKITSFLLTIARRGAVSGWRLAKIILKRYGWLRRILRTLIKIPIHFRPLLKLGAWFLRPFPNVKRKLLCFTGTDPRLLIASVSTHSRKTSTRRKKYPKRTGTITAGQKSTISQKRTIYYWIDHTAQCPTSTGIQRAARCLARALSELSIDIVYVCWNEEKKALVKVTQTLLQNFSQWNGPEFTAEVINTYNNGYNHIKTDVLHKQVSSDKLKDSWLIIPEVTYITYHQTPPTPDVIVYAKAHGMKTAFTYYDAIPMMLEEYKDAREMHRDYIQHITHTDILFPISTYSADYLINYCTTVLNLPVDQLPVIKPLLLSGESYSIQRVNNYDFNKKKLLILSIGTIEPRKNQTTLLEAFQNLCERYPDAPLRLVLCGNLHPKVAHIINKTIKMNPKITHFNYVDDNKLKSLYKQCIFTVFPSVEEGLGLPIIESIWYGKPVICANFGAMAEAAEGGGCLAVDTRSVSELESAMELLLFDPQFRNKLADAAIARPLLSWRDYASEICMALKNFDNQRCAIRKIYYWIDHTCRYPSNSGIQRVTRGLARTLQQTDIQLIPVRWNSITQTFCSPEDSALLHMAKWNGPEPSHFTQFSMPDNESNSWLFIPELITPMGNAPDLDLIIQLARDKGLNTAIIFYDAFPYKHTHIYPPERGSAHAAYMDKLTHCDLIFPISHASSSDLEDYLFNKMGRSITIKDKIIPVQLPGEFFEHSRIRTYQEPSSKTIRILSVSTVEPRKNHVSLLKAFDSISKQNKIRVELILVGSCPFPDLEKEIKSYIAQNKRIQWIKNADDATLADEYAKCHFTVYPSLDEGFGLPILESLWYGRPCICRNASAMAEAAEDGGCLTVDTSNVDELSKAILLLATDNELRAKLGEEAVTRPIKTWSEYTQEIIHYLANKHI